MCTARQMESESSTGLSSSAESRPAGASASGPSSSGPAAVDNSESERDDSQEPGQEEVVSLPSKLRSPRPSDFARKRKIAVNPPCWKRRSRGTKHFIEKQQEHNGRFLQHNHSLELLENIIGGGGRKHNIDTSLKVAYLWPQALPLKNQF